MTLRRVLMAAFGCAFVLGATPAAAMEARFTDVGLPLGSDTGSYDGAVSRMVRMFISYTRWPGNAAPSTLCVIGPADHAGGLQTREFAQQSNLTTRTVSSASVGAVGCDIVYIGRLSLDQQRAITDSLRNSATLTIAENDPACRSRAMVCLLFEAEQLSFRLNVDAVSRSAIRIDPRVLRMGLNRP